MNRPGREDAAGLVRTVLAVDREVGSMTLAGDVPEGSRAQLMRCRVDRLVDGAEVAGKMALTCKNIKEAPSGEFNQLALAVSCVGRRLVLQHRCEEELEGVAETLPQGTPLVGFYSYGELAPEGKSNCELHNQTLTVALFSENSPENSPGKYPQE